MTKGKTPQELYKNRKLKELAERDALLPPGLINHGNTCFMNSVLQGLMAIPYLQQLASMELPESRRSPALTNGRGGDYEEAWAQGLELADVFLIIMNKAWQMKERRQRSSISPKEILYVLGKKYDQYNDFRQQDAHEFLRLLLDAMRMEEFDIIKKRQPLPPREKKSRRKPSMSTQSNTQTPDIPPADRLTSFVDFVFGGQLASILVCDSCKHVSVTNEPFDDLSLSIKPDEAKDRKRDRLRTFAQKFWLPTPSDYNSPARPQSVPPPESAQAFQERFAASGDPRRRSLDRDLSSPNYNEGPSLTHPPLYRPADGLLAPKPLDSMGTKLSRRMSVGWGKRRPKDKEKEKETASFSPSVYEVADSNVKMLDIRKSSGMLSTSAEGSKGLSSRSLSPSAFKPSRPARSKAQSSYVQSLLSDNQSSNPLNPFSYLPPGSSMWTKFAPSQGLEQCLRQFTAVELLEGDNMVGCRRCWKIANGLCEPLIQGDEERYEEDAPEGKDEGSFSTTPQDSIAPLSSGYTSTAVSPASTGIISGGPDMNVSFLDLSSSVTSLPPSIGMSSKSIESRPVDIPQITTEPPQSPGVINQPLADKLSPPTAMQNGQLFATGWQSSLRAPDLYFFKHRRPSSIHSDKDSFGGVESEDSNQSFSDSSIESASTRAESVAGQIRNNVQQKKAKEVIMRRAYKRYLIAKPPPVLVIHLKRFQQVSKVPAAFFGNLKKMDDYVPFPEYLDLSNYLAPRREDFGLAPSKESGPSIEKFNGSCMYRLVSVVVHIGNMLGGHYVAYVALAPSKSLPGSDTELSDDTPTPYPPGLSGRAPSPSKKKAKEAGRQWCYVSDTIVRLATLDEVLKSKAYICMYERYNPSDRTGARM